MICNKCGSTIPDDAMFCVKCGAMIETVPQPAEEPAEAPASDEFAPSFEAQEPAAEEVQPAAEEAQPVAEEFAPAQPDFGAQQTYEQPQQQAYDPNFRQDFQQNYGAQYQQQQYVPQPVQPPAGPNYAQQPYGAYQAAPPKKAPSGAFDFNKVISFITGYFKNPSEAVRNDIEGGDMLSIIIFGALFAVTGILVQLPVFRVVRGGFTFLFGFIFALLAVALPFGISTLLGIVNKKETKPLNQLFAVVLNTPLISVINIFAIITGMFSIKLYIVFMLLNVAVYATAMYPVIREKLPENDGIGMWLNNLVSALVWIIITAVVLVIELKVASSHIMDLIYSSILY